MDEATIRARMQGHADAVLSGDLATARADTLPDATVYHAAIGAAMPAKIVAAELVKVEIGDPTSVAEIHYTGEDGKTATIRSHWEDRDGEPRIIRAESV